MASSGESTTSHGSLFTHRATMMVLPFNPLNIMLIRACQWGPHTPPLPQHSLYGGPGRPARGDRTDKEGRLRGGLPDICFDWRRPPPFEKGGRVARTALRVIRLRVCVTRRGKKKNKKQGASISESATGFSQLQLLRPNYLFIYSIKQIHPLFPSGPG